MKNQKNVKEDLFKSLMKCTKERIARVYLDTFSLSDLRKIYKICKEKKLI